MILVHPSALNDPSALNCFLVHISALECTRKQLSCSEGGSSASMKHVHNTHMLTSCCRLCGDTHCLSLFLTLTHTHARTHARKHAHTHAHTHTHTHTKDLSHDVEAPSHWTTRLGPLDHWIKSSTATGPLDHRL